MKRFPTLLQRISCHLHQKGFTLIEVLIAVVVVGLVLTAVMSALTVSVKNAAESRYRARASTLSQEVVELFSREKTLLGWGEFVAFFPEGTTTYCMADVPSAGGLRTMTGGDCTSNQTIDEAGVVFTRKAVVTKTGNTATEITIEVSTSWIDGSRNPEVALQRIYRKTDI